MRKWEINLRTQQVRSTIPNLTLDEVFEGKNEVSVEVEKQLTEHMTNFGYQIHGALIVDVQISCIYAVPFETVTGTCVGVAADFLQEKTFCTETNHNDNQVSPAAAVKNSMNEINANKRKRIAAAEVAEAQKIFAIKRAEAEAESKYLQGAISRRFALHSSSCSMTQSFLFVNGNRHE